MLSYSNPDANFLKHACLHSVLNLKRDKLTGKIQSISITAETGSNVSQRLFQLGVSVDDAWVSGDGLALESEKQSSHMLESYSPLSGNSSPQDLDSITLGGNGSDASTIDFKASTGQEFIFKVHNDILLVVILPLEWLNIGYLEVLVDVVTLLRNGLDETFTEEVLVLVGNVLLKIREKIST